jgi:hypothetical protein
MAQTDPRRRARHPSVRPTAIHRIAVLSSKPGGLARPSSKRNRSIRLCIGNHNRQDGSSRRERAELRLRQNKVFIPIVEEGVEDHAFLSRLTPVFHFSRWDPNPGRVESEISQFLMQQKLDKEVRQGMGALVAIGLGLFLLASLSKKQCAQPQ